MKKTVIAVPDGYTVITEEKTLPIGSAWEILRSKRRGAYTRAEKTGDGVLLVKTSIVCPFCLSRDFPYETREEIAVRKVENFFDRQTAFFGRKEQKSLSLGFPRVSKRKRVCPVCGETSRRASSETDVTVTEEKGKITLSVPLSDAGDVFSLPWVKGKISACSAPTEEVTFRLSSGHTVLRLKDEDGTLLAVRDLSDPFAWQGGEAYEALKKRKSVKRALKRAFMRFFGGALPFAEWELTPEAFVRMTAFVGYPRAFYDAVPFGMGSGKTDPSFRAAARALHHAKNVPAVYERSGLPTKKSVRRLFFGNPGLLFYTEEAKGLWEAMNNADRFVSLLSSEIGYTVLSCVHQCPGVLPFLAEYSASQGAGALCRLLRKSAYSACIYGVGYVSMNASRRRAERAKWASRHDWEYLPDYSRSLDPIGIRTAPSVPMRKGKEELCGTYGDGFRFSWIRTREECRRAGEALRNCLVIWRPDQNPVMLVTGRDGKALAALEIRGKNVLQAQLAEHDPLELLPEVDDAYEYFMARNRLTDRTEGQYLRMPDDPRHDVLGPDDEELPF